MFCFHSSKKEDNSRKKYILFGCSNIVDQMFNIFLVINKKKTSVTYTVIFDNNDKDQKQQDSRWTLHMYIITVWWFTWWVCRCECRNYVHFSLWFAITSVSRDTLGVGTMCMYCPVARHYLSVSRHTGCSSCRTHWQSIPSAAGAHDIMHRIKTCLHR